VAILFSVLSAGAADQTWNDAGANNNWSTNEVNWDVGTVWVNGNNAIFSGAGGAFFGETVDIADTVTVANITFQTNGYTIADADNNGTMTIVGAPSVVTVATGQTGTVSEVIAGSGGLTKAGNGVLNLIATNTFDGVLRVSSGVLRLNTGALYALGHGGAGNETIVENGATLNFNGAYTNALATSENFRISGSGVDGLGVLVSTGVGFMNGGFGTLTLMGNSTLGCIKRMDLRNTVTGNGYTLTKSGSDELAVGAAVTNCPVVINSGNYTYMNVLALGTSDYDTILNGGNLRSYGTYILTERVIGNGGTIVASGGAGASFNIAGRVLLNSNVNVSAENSNLTLELSGLLEGAGGITRNGSAGLVQVTGNTNTYTGPTWVSSGIMWVGKTNLYSGVLGFGTTTNSGTLYGYSPRMCQGNLVNFGPLYCTTGSLVSGSSSIYNGNTLYWNGGLLGGTGAVTNNGNLYIDRGGAFVCSNGFFGTGLTAIRYGGAMTVSGSVSSNNVFRLGNGMLTLTNGAEFCSAVEMTIADRQSLNYPVDPTNVTATVNILDGTTLRVSSLVIGNGTNTSPITCAMTGTVNQVGGTVRTTGFTAEENGMRLGHYPNTYGTYNMMGGRLTVEKDWDLCIATDGNGWFKQTGGEVFAKRVMLNERVGGGGYGRLTVSGGTMNLGSLSGSSVAISNGIAVDAGGPYLVEFGGAGGVIRAVTNVYCALNATLFGTNANAITFDSTNFAISLSGKLTGAGGLNKTGTGVLNLMGTNTYSGGTAVSEGTLTPAARFALPNGVLAFGISANGTSGVLHMTNEFSLAGLTVAISNPEQLDKSRSYTVVTFEGTLSGAFSGSNLPLPWYVYYNWAGKTVQLRAAVGTMIRVK
jgi:autotransporter-associated beta strand protein